MGWSRLEMEMTSEEYFVFQNFEFQKKTIRKNCLRNFPLS
jgi:hypothetical protein